MSKKLCTLIVPLFTNAGLPLPHVAQNTEKALIKAFGGFTASPAFGGWEDPTGKVQIERVVQYTIAVDETPEANDKLRDIAQQVAIDADQQLVMITHTCGHVEFVPLNLSRRKRQDNATNGPLSPLQNAPTPAKRDIALAHGEQNMNGLEYIRASNEAVAPATMANANAAEWRKRAARAAEKGRYALAINLLKQAALEQGIKVEG